MRPDRFALVILVLYAPGIFLPSPLLRAQASPPAMALIVGGAVEHPLTLSLADLAKMHRSTVEAKGHEGAVIYEGVLLSDLMQAAGVPSGEKLRGADLASCVAAQARDGYRVAFSLAEVDPAFTDTKVLVADHANGKTLGEGQGPFRLIVPTDKIGHRSVRMLERLEVVRVNK